MNHLFPPSLWTQIVRPPECPSCGTIVPYCRCSWTGDWSDYSRQAVVEKLTHFTESFNQGRLSVSDGRFLGQAFVAGSVVRTSFRNCGWADNWGPNLFRLYGDYRKSRQWTEMVAQVLWPDAREIWRQGEKSYYCPGIVQEVKFKESDFEKCNFLEVTVTKTTFADVHAESCSFSSVTFETAAIQSSILKDVTFKDCTFRNTLFADCVLRDVTFTNCVFEHTTIERCEGSDVNFQGGDTKDVFFNSCVGKFFRDGNSLTDTREVANANQLKSLILERTYDPILVGGRYSKLSLAGQSTTLNQIEFESRGAEFHNSVWRNFVIVVKSSEADQHSLTRFIACHLEKVALYGQVAELELSKCQIRGDEGLSTVRGARIVNSDVQAVRLAYSTLVETNFSSGEILFHLSATRSVLKDVAFGERRLDGMSINTASSVRELSDCRLVDCILTEVLRKSKDDVAYLNHDFEGCVMTGTEVIRSKLHHVAGREMNASGTSFVESSLEGFFFNADFSYSVFRSTQLAGSFKGARFTNASLTNVDLSHCDLTGASFDGAQLKAVTVSVANVQCFTPEQRRDLIVQ